MVKTLLDLSQLALERPPASNTARKSSLPKKKKWLSRVVLPLSILLGFLTLVGVAAGYRMVPARAVLVMPVIVKKAGVQQAGTDLFQAPGWIEPQPTVLSVAAMAPGVIEELMVVAGQSIAKGEPIAKLVSTDAELVLRQAQNYLAIRKGELNRARAELTAAHIRVEQPVHLRIPLADAQSKLTKAKTELAKLPFLKDAAKADVKYTLSSMEGKQSARGAISQNLIAKAENDYAVAIANLSEIENRQPSLEREVEALENVVTTLEHQLSLLVEEKRQLAEATAKVQSAVAYCDEAQLRIQQAELALERNTVRAPMNGRILRLVAVPGSRVMGLETTAGQSSSTVVEMYDPQSLQVRADVRLEDIPQVTHGQFVKIETAASSQLIHGQVLQVTSSANIQKNTLEVKIELLDPPTTVSPEMLVTATFLAPTNDGSQSPANETERLFVPHELLQSSEAATYVWVVDELSAARKRVVEVHDKNASELVAIRSGLNVTDKLITSPLEGLREGMRLSVKGDDQTLGFN